MSTSRSLFILIIVCLAFCSFEVANAQPRVYRDRIEPHWFGEQSQFWYRNALSQGAREFIKVNAITGTREPAFDHADVAGQLTVLLGRDVSPEQLPVNDIKFDVDLTSVTLFGTEGQFLWNIGSKQLTRLEPASVAGDPPQLFLPPRASADSAEETELIIVNQLPEPVSLVWTSDSMVERSYGTVTPGETRRQHTFAGHVWMIQRADNTAIGCAQAKSGGTTILLNQEIVDSVRRDERRGRRRRRDGATASAPENPQSPDGASIVFVRDDNLWLRSLSDNAETMLTSDATSENSFQKDAARARSIGMDYDLQDFPEHLADARWSGDSRYVVAMQTTQVAERRVHYVESSPADQLQPKLQSYPYLKAGDPIPVPRPRLFRIADKTEIPISDELFSNSWSLEFQHWSDDGNRFWLLYNERGHQRLRVLEVTVDTGTVRAIVDEFSDTFVHYSSDGKFELRWLKNGQLLWASERTGWNHLYRYDVSNGEIVNAVTSGEWNIRRIEHIDEDAGVLWFFAVGIRPDQDPYHEHFCRVNFDGSGLTILTEGDGMHTIDWSPDRRWFVDRFSRIDLPPVTELRSADGAFVCSLEEADATEIIEDRGRLPERFVAKGRDGTTDIHGIVHRPKDFDPAKSYPVIENIYAGPHDYHVPKAFQARFGHQHRIADAGFIVVQIDGMGTAWRSKQFHDVCCKNLKDAGFPDRIAWIKAAKVVVPQMDLSGVGIYGGSAGGQNAMAALLWHGDFYKAAVADCGCHDNRMDKIWWNEQWMGLPNGDHYAANSNMENAHRLQGRLMLVVGELDRNVDPATTMQVAKKLVDAGKDFELLVVPGAGHGACETPWASKRRTEFFVRSLATGVRPFNVAVSLRRDEP